MLNVDKLLSELRFLTIHPDKWDQSLWVKYVGPENPRTSACGSFGCLAGNAVLRENIELAWYEIQHFDVNVGAIRGTNVWYADYTIDHEHIEEKATELLGLTPHQAERLFDGDNSLDTLWELAESITLGEIDEYDYIEARRERDDLRVKTLKDAEENVNA